MVGTPDTRLVLRYLQSNALFRGYPNCYMHEIRWGLATGVGRSRHLGFLQASGPFLTLGWPDMTDDLKRFYPTSLLVTGFDIPLLGGPHDYDGH